MFYIFTLMKARFILFFLFYVSLISAQKYATRSGQTSFIGSEETFEQIKAINKVSTAIVDSSNGNIAILLFVSAFKFEIALMEEHFNENYMESSKYPKATFVGNIQDFKYEDLTNTENNYDIVGVLAIRGIEKSVTISGRMQKTEQGISLKTNFIILTEDYNIKIPKVVRNKISKKINIKVEYELIEKI